MILQFERVDKIPEKKLRSGQIKGHSKYSEFLRGISEMPAGTKLQVNLNGLNANSLARSLVSALRCLKIKNVAIVRRAGKLYTQTLYSQGA